MSTTTELPITAAEIFARADELEKQCVALLKKTDELTEKARRLRDPEPIGTQTLPVMKSAREFLESYERRPAPSYEHSVYAMRLLGFAVSVAESRTAFPTEGARQAFIDGINELIEEPEIDYLDINVRAVITDRNKQVLLGGKALPILRTNFRMPLTVRPYNQPDVAEAFEKQLDTRVNVTKKPKIALATATTALGDRAEHPNGLIDIIVRLNVPRIANEKTLFSMGSSYRWVDGEEAAKIVGQENALAAFAGGGIGAASTRTFFHQTSRRAVETTLGLDSTLARSI